MARRFLSFPSARFIFLRTQNALISRNASVTSSSKLQYSNSRHADQPCVQSSLSAPFSWLARSHSTQSTKVFFTPPKSLDSHAQDRSIESLVGVNVDVDSKQLVVSWEGGENQIYPFVWLRDNCRCPSCFHPVALARLTKASQLDVEVLAQSAEISSDNMNLIIQWEDGHGSMFPADWLREYSFDKSPRDKLLNPTYSYWGKDIDLQSFDFNQLLEDDQALYDWMYELVIRGIAVVKNTPCKMGQLQRLGERVAFLRQCNYGPTFQVKSKVDPSNPAYTNAALALHTDLAYYIRQPGIQMLHCIEQAEGIGGENVFSDGFKVAMDLKQVDPEAFHLLTTTQFEFYDVGKDHYGDFYQHSGHPVIEMNKQGGIESISISDHGRDPMLRAPVNDVLPIYRALKKYCTMLTAPENILMYKLKEGDIITFNNRRALHGRNSFEVTKISGRHLEGGYLEWDEVNSRLRVLAMQHQSKSR